jgi:hypothetical protein
VTKEEEKELGSNDSRGKSERKTDNFLWSGAYRIGDEYTKKPEHDARD